ncbi:MAG: winged helix DNA-binding domain-containing protein [Anaerolineae bacterium]|nr:winged helix DNA-binding domain-containing protein [Anaerolineae bacterium]
MTALDIVHHRLYNQRLVSETAATPDQIVAWFGAMQAQDYASVKWAIGARGGSGHTITDTAVEQALSDKQIIRTWLMRGTLQMTTAADIRWLLALLAPRLISGSAGRLRELELDQETLTRSFDVLTMVLQTNQPLSRPNILQTLEQAGISTAGQRGYHILGQAALAGLICFGPMQGKQQTFVLLDEWTPPGPTYTRDEALAELARRYLRSHGPATLPDFVWWSGLTITEARVALALVETELQSEVVEGETYWLSDNPAIPAMPSPTAWLLPAFDEYYLGYKTRHVVLDGRYDKRVVSVNGIFRPVIVLDGQVVGIWKREVKRGTAVISLELFQPLTAVAQEAVLAAAEQYSAFLERPVEWVE